MIIDDEVKLFYIFKEFKTVRLRVYTYLLERGIAPSRIEEVTRSDGKEVNLFVYERTDELIAALNYYSADRGNQVYYLKSNRD